jgi:hypothetical protein
MDENEFISIKEQLPEKGKDVEAIDINGNRHYSFRCACKMIIVKNGVVLFKI